ncbi:MAG TPA: SDR family oxidoreductase, partial [Dehalococcoidales bacterium]|nr:SDR family oxidoreductase [Dehalococcoidales bacterium]
KIAHLYFCSTAYTWDCNTYGLSKIRNEEAIARFAQETGARTTIFKPSIIMGTEEHPYPGHFSQFVSTVVKIHHRAELIRKNIEGTLRLPAIEPVFRVKGNPDGKLNLVSVAAVVEAMATIKKPGTYWLTNPNPPTLGQLVEWVSEFIMVELRFEGNFKPMPLELMFQLLASAFSPYLQGDDFPSDIKHHPLIDRSFIHDTIRKTLLS